MILHTDRLILRAATPNDLDAVYAYMSDPEVCRLTAAGPFKKRDTAAFLKGLCCRDDERRGYAIIERDTGELIGHVRCQPYEPETTEVGWILRRDRWGRGYGTEAGRTIAAIAAKLPGVTRISARCRPENTASQRIMEKLGMELVREIENDVLMDGQPAPSLLYVAPTEHVLPKELVAPLLYRPESVSERITRSHQPPSLELLAHLLQRSLADVFLESIDEEFSIKVVGLVLDEPSPDALALYDHGVAVEVRSLASSVGGPLAGVPEIGDGSGTPPPPVPGTPRSSRRSRG